MVAADGRASPWLDVDAILADPEVRIVVCCGAGGVGKTTTAAALGLRAAEQHGRRTVVLTIDPARRLAQALGLTELDNTPRQGKGTNGAAGGRSVFNLVTASFGMFARVVQRVIGGQLLADLSGFVAALDSMFGGFRERAEQTYRILQAPETAFLVVAAPEPDAIREAGYFARRLAADRMP